MTTDVLHADVAVVGGGGAGMAAAVQAAEKGAQVIVLDKRHTVGGNTAMAHGFFAAESSAQKKMRIDTPKDELFKLAMGYHHWTVNPRLVRAYIDKSSDTVKWLEEKGLSIAFITALHPHYLYRTFHMTEHATGNTVIKLLTKNCEDLGVRILCKATVKKLLTNSEGKINGLLASTENGELKVVAESVIITTGGYGGNRKLLKEHYPDYSENTKYVGLKELTGDGLLMAIEIGAATEGLGLPHYWGGHYSGSNIINLINQRPEAVWVNRYGERFCDETILFDMGLRGNIIDRQPGKISFTLFDDNIRDKLIEEGVIGAQLALRWAPRDTTWSQVMEQLPKEVSKGGIKIANSWDDIAQWMGARPDVLRATIDEYNLDCDRGYDGLFVKDRRYLEPLHTPPYYAIKFQQTLLDTMGGIKTNHVLEVLGHDDMPIPGLYAAGVCVGGFQSATYCYELSGTMFGFALNSGRIAADSAVRHISGR